MGSFEVLSPYVLWSVISRAPHKNNTINHKRIPIFFFRAEMALLSWHAFSFLSHVFVLCSIHKYSTIINTSLCFAKNFSKKGNSLTHSRIEMQMLIHGPKHMHQDIVKARKQQIQNKLIKTTESKKRISKTTN